ncbi:MAG TPA: hypothetical protein VNA16_05125, partial [Abditibacteriaceae bacterium]|nr:hypothetical protein [Abditibacteriaceae bacterium]
MNTTNLPMGTAPRPVSLPHFPDRLHAFVWRNWQLVPAERIAAVVGATQDDILNLGHAMGLSGPPRITRDQQRRSALTVIRRNWHLLPYQQLLQLLGWSEAELAFSLREDDFLFGKLGSAKPDCEAIAYSPPDAATQRRQEEIAAVVRESFAGGTGVTDDPLFGFVGRLSRKKATSILPTSNASPDSSETPQVFAPRFCYSYFALYGDPSLEPELDPYPDGYLQRLRECGVDGVWLQAVLYKLAPFPWDAKISERHEERVANLRVLVERARQQGIGIYLYLNEPRAMPLAFYDGHPQLKGVSEGEHAALCTSVPEVQQYLTNSVAHLCRAVPGIAGFFTITSSENFSNCWSHTASNCYGSNSGLHCPRCGKRSPTEVIAEVNTLFHNGIRQAGSNAQFLVWDWAWSNHGEDVSNNWAEQIIKRLPDDASFMSVSEWSMPIQRGGVNGVIGEYSLSVVGPGPRARRHWEFARRRGLKTMAKIQANNTWELSATPYLPVLATVAQHAANLRDEGVDGLMLGWTLGGYPSPNLEVIAEISKGGKNGSAITPEQAMEIVARRRFGSAAAPVVMDAWHRFSAALNEFPFEIQTVYSAPMQYGPSNLLWEKPTGYWGTMIGFPYDDLAGWRKHYPADVFAGQFDKIAAGWEAGVAVLREVVETAPKTYRATLQEEFNVAEAAGIHFRTTANQCHFVM